MSLSLSPIAFIIERCGARMAPSVVSHDRHFPGARLAARAEWSFSCGSLVVVILVVPVLLVVIELESLYLAIRNGTREVVASQWVFFVMCCCVSVQSIQLSMGGV